MKYAKAWEYGIIIVESPDEPDKLAAPDCMVPPTASNCIQFYM